MSVYLSDDCLNAWCGDCMDHECECDCHNLADDYDNDDDYPGIITLPTGELL
jgi:hypothetical protein